MKLLADRYQIEQQLGKKAGRQTFLAQDLQSQARVVVKLLTFSDEFEWNDLKLFEREAATLKELSHPAIPRYLDYFEVNEPEYKGFALVQTYIEARSLEQHLKSGRTFSETEVKQIAEDLLKILGYLHDRQPPVIHRDIKPSNILLGDRSGNSPGQVYLVDFGSVQSMVAKEGGTITIVGTYGYMPPEQFSGRATPASDLYSLGATLIYLVTGQHPASLPQDDLRIEFEEYTTISLSLVNWLKHMTELSSKKRFACAEDALTALETPDIIETIATQQPQDSRIRLTKKPDRLEVVIPHRTVSSLIKEMLRDGSFLVLPTVLFGWFLIAALGLTGFSFPANLIFGAIFLAPVSWLLIRMICMWLFDALHSTRLTIDRQQIAITDELGCIRYHHPGSPQPSLTIEQIVHLQSIYGLMYRENLWIEHPPRLDIIANSKRFRLMYKSSVNGWLSEQEIEWLAQELSQWLGLPIQRQ